MKPILAILAVLGMVAMAPQGAAAQSFGAIAYSPSSGAWGWSSDYGSRGQAERRAIRECRNRGSGCRNAIWFRNACGALAKGNNGGWGANWGNNRNQARSKALRTCRSYGNRGCRIVEAVCSF